MRPKPATKRASRGAMRQKEKSASSKLIACSGKRDSQAFLSAANGPPPFARLDASPRTLTRASVKGSARPSSVSAIDNAVGVWALIVVLSVMNGFQKEVRTRILGVVSHVQISGPGNLLPDWQPVAQAAAQQPHVIASAPFVQGQAMLSAGRAVRGALVRGIEPGMEERVADFSRHMRAGSLTDLKPGEFGIVLGGDLARSLGVIPGEKVALIAPQGVVTPAGVIPRLKQFTVVGYFEAGIVDADSGLALVSIRDAQTLYHRGPPG